MAYWIAEGSSVNNSRQLTYIMDEDNDKNLLPKVGIAGTQQGEDEVIHLPCGRGSQAISIASGKLFILDSNNVWTELGGNTSAASTNL